MSRAHVRGKAGTNVTGDLYVSSDDEDINYITKERLSTRTGKIHARIHTKDRNSTMFIQLYYVHVYIISQHNHC